MIDSNSILFAIYCLLIFFFISYWSVGRVFYDDNKLAKKSRFQVALLIPFAISFPIFFANYFEESSLYYLYLVTFPASIYYLKFLIKDFNWNLSKLIRIYFSLFVKFIAASIFFGLIAKLLVSIVKLLK
jgi:hypothetical protein